MIYFEMYPGDYMRDTSRLSLSDHGAYLRLMLAYYAEEAPLPEAHGDLYVIAGATTTADKVAVRKVADRYFPVGDDGLRHNGRIDEEIAKAQERIAEGQLRKSAKKGNEAERQMRTRARRTKLFEDLRGVGVIPDGLITMDELRALHVKHVSGSDAATNSLLSHVTEGDMSRVTKGVTDGVNTGNQTPDPTVTPDTSLHTQGSLGGVTDAGRACRLMRLAGCIHTNPSHAALVAGLAEGITPETFGHTAAEAVQRTPAVSDPFTWAIQTARNRHAAARTATTKTSSGATNANPQFGSADHVTALREEYERTAGSGGAGGYGGAVVDADFVVVQ